MKPTKSNSNQADAAKKWKCSERTIRRWIAAGAPVHDEQAMQLWIASRKHTPKGTADMLTGQADKAAVQAATTSARDHKQGAAAALRRLEAEEVDAFERLGGAIAAGKSALE